MNVLCGLMFLLIAQMSFAQTTADKINAYVLSYAETNDFAGCILVARNDSVIFSNCYGKANYSFNVDNTAETKYKIGSISKQFTAAAILRLEEMELLNTADTLSTYFPDSKNAKKITIEQLLTHTSGVIDIYNLPDFTSMNCTKTSLTDLAVMILDHELLYKPGERYQYSNGGYALLAQIIEQVSGEDYGAFLTRQIFKPLGMNSSGHYKTNSIVSNLAVGYNPLDYEDLVVCNFLDNDLFKGSGSLYSTVDDMLIWINTLKNHAYFSKDSYEKLFRDYGNSYGYGISVYKSFGSSVFGHDGRISGYIADYLHYIEPDVTVIIAGNIQTGVADFLRRDIAAILFNKDYQSSAKNVKKADQYPEYVPKLVGAYGFGPNFTVYIDLIDGLIQARANQGTYSELIPLADGRFFSRTLYSYIQFETDEKGRIAKMIWINNDGNSFEGAKKN